MEMVLRGTASAAWRESGRKEKWLLKEAASGGAVSRLVRRQLIGCVSRRHWKLFYSKTTPPDEMRNIKKGAEDP